MLSILRTGLFSISLACFAHPAQAITTDEDMCRNGLFPSLLKNVRLATFAGEANSRLYFFNDIDGCPSSGNKCQSRSYVVPGDELIVSKQHGDWSCAWYAGKTHETVGWVRNHQLQVVAPDDHPEWNGKWKQYTYPGYISIARKAENYYVLGNTKWIGMQLPDGTRAEHFGELEGQLRVENSHAYLGIMGSEANPKYDCAAQFVRLGRFLIVHDNSQCGGTNVSFDGVYTMAPRR